MKLEYKWTCPICNNIFNTRKELQNHIKTEKHYKNNLKDNYEWICPIKIYYAKNMIPFLNYVYEKYGKDFIKLYDTFAR